MPPLTEDAVARAPTGAAAGLPLRVVALAALAAVLVAFPLVVTREYPVFIATQVGVYLMVAIGLNLPTGYGGMTSLGHGALLAIGAYTAAILMVDHHWSFWAAAPVAIGLSAIAGGLMALPALRVSTWYFALISLAFAEVVSDMLIEWDGLTHAFSGVVGVPMPRIGGLEFTHVHLFWTVAAVNVVLFVVTARLVRSRIGRALIAVRDNEEAAIASGVSVPGVKLFAFVVSAAMAGIAGAFFAVQKTVITPDDFRAEFSIFFLVVVVLGGAGRLWGPVIGTLVFFVVPELLEKLQSWRLLVYGVLLLALILFAPQGLQGALERLWARFAPRRAQRPADGGPVATRTAVETDPPRIEGARVTVERATRRFGGVVAVDGVDLDVAAGEVHAIVGPNGSGKTTLLNLVSGYYALDDGQVRIDGREASGRGAARLARDGVGRTFQTPKLLPTLTVLENAMLGGYAAERATVGEIALALPRAGRERTARIAHAMRYLEFVGLASRADTKAGDLPHGQQRLAEIARAMAARPRVLLLDEPAAGLSLSELERLATVIRAIRGLGVTVLIVEHRLELVADVCASATVLDRGRVLARGTPAEVFSSPEVVAAYMGVRPVEVMAGRAP